AASVLLPQYAGRVTAPGPVPGSGFGAASAYWSGENLPAAIRPTCAFVDIPPATDSRAAQFLRAWHFSVPHVPARERHAESPPHTPPHSRRARLRPPHNLSLQVASAGPPPDP